MTTRSSSFFAPQERERERENIASILMDFYWNFAKFIRIWVAFNTNCGNCLNFGSPEKEDNMGEFVECVQGIGEASKYLNFPVVSGNVSFYNQTKEVGIKPTPSIGGVGLIKDYKKMISMDLKEIDNLVIIIGKTEGHIDQSLFARTILDEKKWTSPRGKSF